MVAQDIFTPNKAVPKNTVRGVYLAWAVVFLLVSSMGISKILPTPLDILRSIPNLWMNWGLGAELMTSITLNLQATFFLGVFAMGVAYLSVIPAMRPLASALSLGRFNGFVGIPLLLTLILKNPHWVKVALLVFGAGVFTIPSLVQIIRDIPQDEFDHARTLRFPPWRVAYEVIVRGRLAEFIDSIRTNAAMVWMLVPVVEGLFRYEGGIGALMIDLNKHMQLEAVYAITLIVLGIGLVQDYVIGRIKATLCPYTGGR